MGDMLLSNNILAKIHYVVNHLPQHRSQPTSCQHRFAMLKIALHNKPCMLADDREIQRKDYSYTVDTLKSFRADYGAEQPLAFILGADSFLTLNTWKQWLIIPKLAHLIVLNRPTMGNDPWPEYPTLQHVTDASDLQCQPVGLVWVQKNVACPISATMVREQTRTRGNITNLLPDGVDQYIFEHKLYRQT